MNLGLQTIGHLQKILCLASSVGWIVQGAVVVLLQRQDRLVVLLERQEVNPEAVRHRLLLCVVLELASFMKEHLRQSQTLRSWEIILCNINLMYTCFPQTKPEYFPN